MTEKTLTLVRKGSECSLYKGIGHKEANVLGRYGYFFTTISDFVTLVESSLKILFGTQETFGGSETTFQVKIGFKRLLPLSQRA